MAQQHDTVRVEALGDPGDQPVQLGRAEEVADLRDHDQVEGPVGPLARGRRARARVTPGSTPASRGAASCTAHRAAVDRDDLARQRAARSSASAPREQPTSRARRKRWRGSAASVSSRLRCSYHRDVDAPRVRPARWQLVEGVVGESRPAVDHEVLDGRRAKCAEHVGRRAAPRRRARDDSGCDLAGVRVRPPASCARPPCGRQVDAAQLRPRRRRRAGPCATSRSGYSAAGRRYAARPRRPPGRRPRGRGGRRGATAPRAACSRPSPIRSTRRVVTSASTSATPPSPAPRKTSGASGRQDPQRRLRLGEPPVGQRVGVMGGRVGVASPRRR